VCGGQKAAVWTLVHGANVARRASSIAAMARRVLERRALYLCSTPYLLVRFALVSS
jgi:hypothetical protein